jgi:hypothetical protein
MKGSSIKNIFDIPEKEHRKILRIVERYRDVFPDVDKMFMAMSVTAVHSSIHRLDLDQLIEE